VSFFEELQGAAVFKHALLRQYLRPFVTKIGSRSTGGQVAYLDAFAGAGMYDDGSPGSPRLALETAEALSAFRELRCYFVESNSNNFERLSELIASSQVVGKAKAMRGDAAHYLQPVLDDVGDLPLLVFVDPFGLGIPFDDLIGKVCGRTSWVNGRRAGPATEVLVNFVHAGVYRNASKVTVRSDDRVQHANAAAVVERVNATFGGAWWQAVWAAGGPTERRVAEIRDKYAAKVVAAAGGGWRKYTVQVQDSWKGRPVYDLILFTQSEHGMWVFNEATSLARKEFREFCNEDERPTLWDPEDEWIAVLERNVHELLRAGRPIRVFDHIEAIFGSTLGFARGTHLRAALRKLNEAGSLAEPPKGEFDKMVLMRNPHGLTDLHQASSLF
jgi:three-Cys-motif partner protein